MCSHHLSDSAFLQLQSANMRVVIIVTVTLITFSGFSHSNKVDQSPPDVIKSRGESAEIQCRHSVTNYNQINWYRQNQDHGFTLMGYLFVKDPNREKEFTEKIEMSGDGNSDGSLSIKSLSSNDSAVYFCAARQGDRPAYFGQGTKLTVLDPTIKVSTKEDINVTILTPSEKELCEKKVTLVCVARNFYPDHVKIKWEIGDKEQTNRVATDPHAKKDDTGKFTISSRLKVPIKQWRNPKNKFKCVLNFYNGSQYFDREAEVKAIEGSGYTREDYVNSSQMMKLGYGVLIAKSGLYGIIICVFIFKKSCSGK